MRLRGLIVILLICNLISFYLFFSDKKRAKRKMQRIPENLLLLSGFLMGAPGGIFGMSLCHHKTKKMKFVILMPIALIFNGLVIFIAFYFMGIIVF